MKHTQEATRPCDTSAETLTSFVLGRAGALRLMSRSSNLGAIVSATYTPELHAALVVMSDDYTDTNSGFDYWADADVGDDENRRMAWRIELKKPDAADNLPLCLDCLESIGGACGGPDMDTRPCNPGEACGAEDCVSASHTAAAIDEAIAAAGLEAHSDAIHARLAELDAEDVATGLSFITQSVTMAVTAAAQRMGLLVLAVTCVDDRYDPDGSTYPSVEAFLAVQAESPWGAPDLYQTWRGDLEVWCDEDHTVILEVTP